MSTAVRTIDLRRLPQYDISSQSPLWWGQMLLCAIEGTMFAILIAAYFYLRLRVDVWPGVGVQLPELTWSSLAFIPLILSCAGSYWASGSAKKGNRPGVLVGLAVNIILAAAFFALETYSWHLMNFSWSSDVHGSIVWTLLGLYMLDCGGGMIEAAVFLVIFATRRGGQKQRLGIHVDSIVWYFLVGLWLPLYAIIYWGPRWLGGTIQP